MSRTCLFFANFSKRVSLKCDTSKLISKKIAQLSEFCVSVKTTDRVVIIL